MATSRQAAALHAGLLVAAAVFVVWIRTLPLALATVGDDLRPEIQYLGEDGRQHVYLGDYDSYLWLRHARNYLRNGTTCDAIVAGECRDTYTHAPVGRRMRYARSLHIAAIVALQRFVTLFHPRQPLAATAFWVPVVVAVVGVVPAYFLGLRVAGPLGGLAAVVLINVDPLFLRRSFGADNDVWNVVLPLWMVWAAVEAIVAPTAGRRIAWALVAAVFSALHGAVWRGWIFGAGVVAIALVVDAVARAVRARAIGRTALVDAALALVVLAAGAAVARWIGGPEDLSRLAGSHGLVWPDTFTTVSELAPQSVAEMAAESGGRAYFLLAFVGALLAALPSYGWRLWDGIVLVAGIAVGTFALAPGDPGGRATFPLLAVALAAALALGVRDVTPRQRAGLVLVVWLVAGAARANAVRFILLMVAPLGLLAALTLGRAHEALRALVARRLAGTPLRLASGALLVLVATAAVPALRRGAGVARDYGPRIDDAWWDTLVHIRDTTSPDAIVDTWWDYGHWAKYVAERRVTMDGASLRTHIPYWPARALLAPTEREAIGLLRMLNCGSDATPEPEGRGGAWARVVGYGIAPRAALSMIIALASLDRTGAADRLAAQGLPAAAVEDVLRSTHCTPPPAYLVLSADLGRLVGWRRLGAWNFERDTPGPDAGYLVHEWLPCKVVGGDGSAWQCAIGKPIDASGRVLLGLGFRSDAPSRSRAYFERAGARDGRPDQVGTPGLLLVADAAGVEEIAFPDATEPGLAFLVDTVGRRVLAGPPFLIRSTYTRLLYLGPEHTPHFTKVDDRLGKWGERVVAWRIEPTP